jgi:3-oxoadipate enol-lactonase
MAGSLESWDEVIPELAPAVRILRYDQRGFGLSERSSRLSMQQMVADLAALLVARVPGERVVLAGAALGAALAIAFAHAHPDAVLGLVLASPALGGSTAAGREAMRVRHERLRSGGMRAVTDAMFQVTYPDDVAWNPERRERHRRRWLCADPEAFIAVNEMIAGLNLEPVLQEIECPALVVGCTHDRIRTPARCAEIAARLPRGSFVECASGHFFPLQHPHLFALQLREFLEELAARDGPRG